MQSVLKSPSVSFADSSLGEGAKAGMDVATSGC